MIDWLLHQVQNNDIFAGVLAASGFGTVLFALRSVPAVLLRWGLRCMSVELAVHNVDQAFYWTEQWIAAQPYAKRTRRLKVVMAGGRGPIPDDDSGGKWAFVPGSGRHVFMFRGRVVAMHHEVADQEQRTGFLAEKYVFRVFGRGRAIARAILEEAEAMAKDDRRVKVHTWRDGYWQVMARKLGRDLGSVVLLPGQIEAVAAKIEWFIGAETWFVDRGVPYRLGMLFEGPPGTGKSSLVMALAGHFRRPLYVLNLGALKNDDALLCAFANVPAHALLVIEDVDAAGMTHARGEKEDDKASGVTMSALLNVIDGVIATDGRILVMTTNHSEKLDPALVRPGRVDHRLRFGPIGPAEINRMFARFHPEAGPIDGLGPEEILPAELQGVLMAHADSPTEAARKVRMRTLKETVDA